MPGMLAAPVPRVVEHGRRRGWVAKWSVIADINPTSSGIGLPLGQDWNRRIVPMEPIGRKNMVFKTFKERLQCYADRADLIGQGREADGDPFAGQLLGLAVQWLVIAKLLHDDPSQKIGSSPSPRRCVERGRRLADCFAIAAGKLLPHRLQDEEPARDFFRRVRRRLAQLGQSLPAASMTGCWRSDDNSLTWQMGGKLPAGGPLAGE